MLAWMLCSYDLLDLTRSGMPNALTVSWLAELLCVGVVKDAIWKPVKEPGGAGSCWNCFCFCCCCCGFLNH